MAYLTVLAPVHEVVGAYAALQARARAWWPGSARRSRPTVGGAGAVMADTALRVLSGRAAVRCSRWRCTW